MSKRKSQPEQLEDVDLYDENFEKDLRMYLTSGTGVRQYDDSFNPFETEKDTNTWKTDVLW